ncbi:hypothetical protein [Streptomyces sp. PTD5-9]|uniref:hypothetical protein n=1 Tax=Streptomyces sp. PTD5-9 TaxID=3120150 RepID=UPI00300914F7
MREQRNDRVAQASHDHTEAATETDSPEPVGDKGALGRRARILAGLTVGAVVVTAVAAGDPTPTMASWA